ncbi:hypothetical protein phiG2_17 [Lysinibacillus phage phiG2]|nr:hypothetical protein phiG2_17 [Lysinibacillus phage phiG2]
MNKYVPVATVIVAVLLLYNVIPSYITLFLVIILLLLLVNKWDKLSKIFQ